MRFSARQRAFLAWENRLFYLLVILMAAALLWLASAINIRWDLTANQSNRLSEASREVVARIKHPVKIMAFVNRQKEVGKYVSALAERYRKAGLKLELTLVNPEADPDLAREHDITRNGEMIVTYLDRSQRVLIPREQQLTNALMKLQRAESLWIAVLSGHSERLFEGDANHDWGSFAAQLDARGYAVRLLQLNAPPVIPDNAAMLVIASARKPLTEEEAAAVVSYVERGGNLLITIDPDESNSVEHLLAELGLAVLPGSVIDAPSAAKFRIDNPAFIPVAAANNHPTTVNLEQVVLLPRACAIELTDLLNSPFVPLMQVSDQANRMQQGSMVNAPEAIVAVAGVHSQSGRVAVICDGDFIANSFLGNGSNLQFGLNLISWLSGEEQTVKVVRPARTDLRLSLSNWQAAGIEIVFKFLLPLIFTVAGLIIWRNRKRR